MKQFLVKISASILLSMLSLLGLAQVYRLNTADETIACFSTNVKFSLNGTKCPDGIDCFAVLKYDNGKFDDPIKIPNDTVELTETPSHLFDLDGKYNVSMSLHSRVDSTVVGSHKFSSFIKVYNPNSAVISDLEDSLRSYIHTYSVDNFVPFDSTVWKTSWNVERLEGGRTDSIKMLNDPITVVYPDESVTDGYEVKLKVYVDEFAEDLFLSDPASCYYEYSEFFTVTDNYFTGETRELETIEDRVPDLFNVITPDGDPNDSDNANDVFEVTTNGVDEFTVWIYNNFGNVVFTQTGKEINWTGYTNSGKRVKSGSYYYVIESNAEGDKHTATGFVHVFNQDM